MSINVLKIGGGAGVDHQNVLENLAQRIHRGEQWIVVHGVSERANQLAEQAGIPVRTITSPSGHVSRHTDEQMIDLYTEAVRDVNQVIRWHLETAAIDTTPFDTARVIQAQRKEAIRAMRNGRQIIIRNDYSGRIINVLADDILQALEDNTVPVIAPIAISAEGENLNVDGDVVAAEIANAIQADTLIILSNVQGLLRDIADENSIIQQFNLHEMHRYEDFAQGRMKKKLIAAQTANIRRVILSDSRINNPLDEALSGTGTHILQENIHAHS